MHPETEDFLTHRLATSGESQLFAALMQRPPLKPVVLESPFAGDVSDNLSYARACMRDCIMQYHEAPIASHLLYTQEGILDDDKLIERQLGIHCGLLWGLRCTTAVFYLDRGWSPGMEAALQWHTHHGKEIITRRLPS